MIHAVNPKNFKLAVEQWVATNRIMPTSVDLTNLYNTSVLCYRAANFWADNVIAPKYVPHYNGEPVEEDDARPLPKLLRSPSFKRTLWRKSLTESFWGRDLVYIVRNWFAEPIELHWINPNMYGLFYSMEGLRPFFVYKSSRFEPVPGLENDMRIELEESIYTHLFDFRNDYDGTSPAEVAFLQASANVEMAQTWNAVFRNLAIPAAIVQPPVDDSAQRDQKTVSKLIDRLRQIVQGSINAGRTLVSPDRWEWITLQPPFKDLDFSTITSETKEAIATAFAVNIEFFTTGQTNYAELEGKIKLWRENTLKPRCEHYAAEYTEQLAHPYYGREWTIVADFSKILPENENEKLTTIRGKLDSLLITIGQAQEEMGLEIDPVTKDYRLVEGIPVPVDQLPVLWQSRFAPQQPAGFPFSFNGGMQTGNSALPTTPAPLQMEAAAKDIDGVPLWTGLSLAGSPELVHKQQQVQAYCGDIACEWVEPSDYHVTLFYARSATPEQAYAFADAVRSMDKPDLTIGVGGLRVFDSDDSRGQYALHFRVSENSDLMDYQEEIYATAVDLGITPSNYSAPDGYKPHITLGYAQTKPRSRRFGRDSVTPQAVVVSLDNVELARVALTEDEQAETNTTPTTNTAAQRELTQWREKAHRKGASKAIDFKAQSIPEDVQMYVRDALNSNPQATRPLINAIFVKAKEKLPADEPEGSLEPPKKLEGYWDSYDRIMAEIGHEWVGAYMQRAWQQLSGQLSKNTDKADVKKLLAEYHEDLVNEWAGTSSTPGAMLKVILAGMTAGQDALTDGVNPKPGKAINLAVDWSLVSEEALKWVQSYLFKLIKGIDQTTAELVQEAIAAWLKEGGTLEDLTDAIEPIFKDRRRAELISQTESSRLFFEGSQKRWEDAGVKKMRFRTVNDQHVCPVCSSLNGQIATLGEGWKVNGSYKLIPIHPGCRCYSSPVID